jgi:hypothetical protein
MEHLENSESNIGDLLLLLFNFNLAGLLFDFLFNAMYKIS